VYSRWSRGSTFFAHSSKGQWCLALSGIETSRRSQCCRTAQTALGLGELWACFLEGAWGWPLGGLSHGSSRLTGVAGTPATAISPTGKECTTKLSQVSFCGLGATPKCGFAFRQFSTSPQATWILASALAQAGLG